MKTCKTLARMAAKALALAEDTVVFQGANGILPGNVSADCRDVAGTVFWERRTQAIEVTATRPKCAYRFW
jgi:hypothetical protein